MDGYSSAPCLVTYSTGISYIFSTRGKTRVSRSTPPALTFLFIGTVLIKVQAEIMPLLPFMPLRNQAFVRPRLPLGCKETRPPCVTAGKLFYLTFFRLEMQKSSQLEGLIPSSSTGLTGLPQPPSSPDNMNTTRSNEF